MTTPQLLSSSPLQLERHEFTEIHLVANQTDSPEGGFEIGIQKEFKLHDANPRSFILILTIQLSASDPDKPCPYDAKLTISGHFNVAEVYQGNPEQLIDVTGASILYGAAREMLANLTSRGPHGLVSLPSVSFLSASPAKKSAKKAAKKKAATKAGKKISTKQKSVSKS